MKLSVSVPDDLWNAAVAISGIEADNISPSAMVQIALRDYIQAEIDRWCEGAEESVSFT